MHDFNYVRLMVRCQLDTAWMNATAAGAEFRRSESALSGVSSDDKLQAFGERG